MTDLLQPLSTSQLAAWVNGELTSNSSLFGIPSELFFRPSANNRFTTTLYGRHLETPIGVAAGPHSQLAHNLVVAWLCGARLLELKTVQTLDRLEIPRPCIDMEDVGYNVEWSQELPITESFHEYCRAWILIHLLHHRLGFPGEQPGVCFNLSVGYDLAGIKQDNVQRFLACMTGGDPDAVLDQIEQVATVLPEVRDLAIPTTISDNVTLSTMHGCPPEEIGQIATYLLRECGLHTSVKLNPTLLGDERLRHLLHERLGYHDITVPDSAFAHDLRLAEALDLIRELRATAQQAGVELGLKLSNTLEVENRRQVFAAATSPQMYLSGRPLLGLTVNLARLLTEQLGEQLPMLSYAGGADACSLPSLLAAGMKTVTTCSDLLRPGGYLRLVEYLEQLDLALDRVDAGSLAALTLHTAAADDPTAGQGSLAEAARHNLARLADQVLDAPAVQHDTYDRRQTKTARPLGPFDCTFAPCREVCPVSQAVPDYLRAVQEGEPQRAATVVCRDNPLPVILGRACDHACEQVCTRTHSDHPVAIRELKRFIMDQAEHPAVEPVPARHEPRVAIIGAGPCGLAAARELRRHGLPVTIFEAAPQAGGMVTATIPGYRAAADAVQRDLAAIAELGVELRFGQRIGSDLSLDELRAQGFGPLVIAVGASQGRRLGLENEQCPQVRDGLAFLRDVKTGALTRITGRVGVIGGGDVAVDCARSARRLGADQVTVIYRRTVDQMPARREEQEALLAEGIELHQLVAPRELLLDHDHNGGKLSGLRCTRMQLGEPDASGRRRPIPIAGEELELELEHLIVAIGQEGAFSLLDGEEIRRSPAGYLAVDPQTLETSVENVYAGGDAIQDGPATIVKACGDGKRIAEAIVTRAGLGDEKTTAPPLAALDRSEMVRLLRQRCHRPPRVTVPELPPAQRSGFDEVVQTLAPEPARQEAARCLECDRMCSTCVTVCPNRALFTYQVQPRSFSLPRLRWTGAGHSLEPDEPFHLAQPLQVAVLRRFCNECGNCVTFCPAAGRPFHDKPHICLDVTELEHEQDRVYLPGISHGRPAMAAKLDGSLHHCVIKKRAGNGAVLYHTAGLTVTFTVASIAAASIAAGSSAAGSITAGNVEVRAVHGEPGTEAASISLVPCLEMLSMLSGLRSSMPWLPATEIALPPAVAKLLSAG